MQQLDTLKINWTGELFSTEAKTISAVWKACKWWAVNRIPISYREIVNTQLHGNFYSDFPNHSDRVNVNFAIIIGNISSCVFIFLLIKRHIEIEFYVIRWQKCAERRSHVAISNITSLHHRNKFAQSIVRLNRSSTDRNSGAVNHTRIVHSQWKLDFGASVRALDSINELIHVQEIYENW